MPDRGGAWRVLRGWIRVGVVALAGCASTPSLLDEPTRMRVDSVVVPATKLAPEGWEIDDATLHQMTAADGAARGAARGTLNAANLLGSGSCEGWICGGVALIWLTTLAVGAVIGAVSGVHEADTEADLHAALAPHIRSFRTVAESLDVPADVNAAIIDAFLAGADRAAAMDPAAGTVFLLHPEPPSHRVVLETEVHNVRFDEFEHTDGTHRYALELFVRYALTDDGANHPHYESFAYARRGPWPLADWVREDAELFRHALSDAYRQLAEFIVDDVAYIYRSPAQSEETTEYALGYFLDPVYPPRIKRPFPVKAHDIGFGFAGTYELWDHQPLLRWTAVPHRSKDEIDDWATLGIAPESLRYDVRVYGQGGEVARSNGLEHPQYRVPHPLPGCTGYFWTFRARFDLDGRERVTDWSGVYNGWEPWNTRYPRVPGIVKDRDEVQGMLDRVSYLHRFWVKRGPNDSCD